MEILKQLLPVILQGSLAAMVLAVGLDATAPDLLYLARHPRRFLRAFLAISVVVPVVAAIVVTLLPVHPISKAGIMLMAVAPVPPLMPGKGLTLGGRKAYVYGLYAAFALLAVVLVPVTLAILDAIYGKSVGIAPAAIAKVVLAGVLAPLAAGLGIQRLWPRFAAKAAAPVSKFSLLLLVIAVIPVVIAAWPAMVAVTGDGTVIAIVAIVLAALTAGHMLGGPDQEDRHALAGAAAIRHPGIALLIANANFQDKRLSALILLFVLVGVVAMIPYQLWIKRARHGDVNRIDAPGHFGL